MADNLDYTDVVDKLRKNFQDGKMRSLESRIEQLQQMYKLFEENEEEIYGALYKDLHKCKVEADLMEVLQIRTDLGITIQELDQWMKPERVSPDLFNKMNQCEIRREPVGVALIIGAWNYPINLVFMPLIGALAAGNCVIIKPSELSPYSAAVIEKLVPKYLSQDVVRVINGGVPETTALLHQRFDHIFYTGGTVVAKIIMKAASTYLTPVTLELGGKCPAIVDATCDYDVIAQRMVWAKFCNAGQTCLAVDYVVCVGDGQNEIVESMKKAVKRFYGDNPKESDSYGRIINKRHFQRVKRLITDSKVAFGNITDEDNLYISPTIMTNVTEDDPVMSEEIFGPILPIITAQSVKDAISLVNRREKPLALYIFSNNQRTIDTVSAETSSGGVCVNDALVHAAVPTLPFGGIGYSGVGAYHGRYSFETFSHKKSYLHKNQKLESVNAIRYPPYDENWKVLHVLKWLLQPTPKQRTRLNHLHIALFGVLCAVAYHFLFRS